MKITFQLPGADGSSEGTSAVNLRQSSQAGRKVLTPVGPPAVVAAAESSAAHHLGGDGMLLVGHDGLGLTHLTAAGAEVPLGRTVDRIRSVVADGDGFFWLLTDSGPESMVRDESSGRYVLTGPLPPASAVALSADGASRISALVPAVTLGGSYRRGQGVLDAPDSESVGAAMLSAYRSLALRAAMSGARMQPVLAAWQLRDDGGRVLFRSTPFCLDASTGFQLAGPCSTTVAADSDGNYSQVASFYVSADTWTPRVRVSADGVSAYWREYCAALEILAVDEADFTEGHTVSAARMDSAVAAAGSSLRAFMPGAASGMDTDTPGLGRLLVNRLAGFDSGARVVAVVNRPFAGAGLSGTEIPLVFPSQPGQAAEAVATGMDPELCRPGGFSAMTTLGLGSAVFHAGIRSVPAQGPSPLAYAVESADSGSARMMTVADMAGGTVRVTRSAGGDRVPAVLAPMLVYPSARAESLRLQVADGCMDFPLLPSPAGDYSYWLSPDLKPVRWSGRPHPWSDGMRSTDSGRFYPGMILAAPMSRPLAPGSAAVICPGSIFRLTVPVGSSGGWNYGRHHLMAWGADGVYAVSADRALRSIAASLVHSPGVSRADAVAVAPECIYAVMSTGRVMRFTGARATAMDGVTDAVCAGWSGVQRELWTADPAGRVTVLTARGGYFSRTDVAVLTFCTEGCGPLHFLDSGGRLRDAGDELRPENVNVSFRCRVPHPLGSGLMRWTLDAEQAVLVLSLLADSGGGLRRVVELSVGGSVNAPVAARFFSPRREYVTVAVSGTVTAPASLHSLEII